MRPSLRLLRLAKPNKAQRLRSLIDLYHSTSAFPSQKLQTQIDHELLSRNVENFPEAMSWSSLDAELDFSAAAGSEGDLIDRSKAVLGQAVSGQKGSRAWEKPASRLMQGRLLSMMDALHGTSKGTNAGLDIVRARTEQEDGQLDQDSRDQIPK